MSREKYKAIMRSQFAENPRYCTRCGQKKPRQGGRDVAIHGGLRQRWVCADCGAKHGR